MAAATEALACIILVLITIVKTIFYRCMYAALKYSLYYGTQSYEQI
jgi:hypothetical protein